MEGYNGMTTLEALFVCLVEMVTVEGSVIVTGEVVELLGTQLANFLS